MGKRMSKKFIKKMLMKHNITPELVAVGLLKQARKDEYIPGLQEAKDQQEVLIKTIIGTFDKICDKAISFKHTGAKPADVAHTLLPMLYEVKDLINNLREVDIRNMIKFREHYQCSDLHRDYKYMRLMKQIVESEEIVRQAALIRPTDEETPNDNTKNDVPKTTPELTDKLRNNVINLLAMYSMKHVEEMSMEQLIEGLNAHRERIRLRYLAPAIKYGFIVRTKPPYNKLQTFKITEAGKDWLTDQLIEKE